MNKHIQESKKIYIDANIIIYLLEDQGDLRSKALDLFEYGEERGIVFCTSDISMAECLYGAYKKGSEALVKEYERFFYQIGAVRLIPVEPSVLENSARIGAERRLKLIDAVHVASAIETGCDVLVTNDKGIKSTDTLSVVQIADL